MHLYKGGEDQNIVVRFICKAKINSIKKNVYCFGF